MARQQDSPFTASPLAPCQQDNHIISFFRRTCGCILPLISLLLSLPWAGRGFLPQPLLSLLCFHQQQKTGLDKVILISSSYRMWVFTRGVFLNGLLNVRYRTRTKDLCLSQNVSLTRFLSKILWTDQRTWKLLQTQEIPHVQVTVFPSQILIAWHYDPFPSRLTVREIL